jgi:uncharacterized membrane protein YbhN (UPF0104 family)
MATATSPAATAATGPTRTAGSREPDPSALPTRPVTWTVKLVLSAGAAAALLIAVLPHIAGEGWGAIWHTISGVGPAGLALLTAVWLLGLWVHTPALTAALPGLSHRRALELNLTGSFVSNLLPLGGAAGTVANWSMARSWGFSSHAFTRWAILTNVADTAVKLVLPALALTWLALAGTGAGGEVSAAAYLGLAMLLAFATAVWLLARDDRAVRVVGRAADRVCARVRLLGAPAEPWAERAVAVRRDCVALAGSGWRPMALGKLGYAALQAVLLWLALRLLGAEVAPAVVLAAFAVERVLSMAVITPSGTGIVEAGMAGVLVALHTAPGAAVAAVLLYRAFVVGMEIPVGGTWLALWAARQVALRRPENS